VTTIASLPMYLVMRTTVDPYLYARGLTIEEDLRVLEWQMFAILLGIVLTTLSQAIVLYGAFQDMLGRRVDLGASVQVGLRRYLPVLGVALLSTLLTLFGFAALIVPGLVAITRWSVAMPACIVDRLGVAASFRRSADLTRGHRWKILGTFVLLVVADVIVDALINPILGAAGDIPEFAGHVIWSGIWGAVYAVSAVVLYHDLRVAKDGVDTAEIAAVFE
jgi:hypothetical protein